MTSARPHLSSLEQTGARTGGAAVVAVVGMRAERGAHDELTVGVERLVDARRSYHLFCKNTTAEASTKVKTTYTCMWAFKKRRLLYSIAYLYFFSLTILLSLFSLLSARLKRFKAQIVLEKYTVRHSH